MSQFTLDEFSSTAVSDTHPCTLCDEWEFDSAEELKVHHDACQNETKRTYQCAHCGEVFTDYISRREARDRQTFYCCRDCKNEGARAGEWKECAECGDDVWIQECRLKTMGDYAIHNHFCDKECESAWKGREWVGENHPVWDGGDVDVSCTVCDEEFGVKPAKYAAQDVFCCSRECTGVYQRADPETRECGWCSEDITRQPHEFKTDTAYCSDECRYASLSEQRRGPANPAWKGGKRTINRVRSALGDQSWQRIAAEVREEYGNVCWQCGGPPTDRKLAVHHLIPVASGGTNGKWNLVPLCGSCHRKIETQTRQFTDVHLFPS